VTDMPEKPSLIKIQELAGAVVNDEAATKGERALAHLTAWLAAAAVDLASETIKNRARIKKLEVGFADPVGPQAFPYVVGTGRLLLGLALGLAALRDIPRAEDPSLTFPGASVVVAYPGADPADIEKLIVDPIEDAVNELDDVKKLESECLDGLGIVHIEFWYGVDPERKYDEVVREMGALRQRLPADRPAAVPADFPALRLPLVPARRRSPAAVLAHAGTRTAAGPADAGPAQGRLGNSRTAGA